jgi:hypothetical protein
MKDFKDEIAILVTQGPDLLSPTVRGWTTREYFELMATPMNFGYGQRLVLKQDALFPLESLVTLHQEWLARELS